MGVISRLVVDPPVPLPHESCLRIWSASGRVGRLRPLALGFEPVRDIEGDVASAGGAESRVPVCIGLAAGW